MMTQQGRRVEGKGVIPREIDPLASLRALFLSITMVQTLEVQRRDEDEIHHENTIQLDGKIDRGSGYPWCADPSKGGPGPAGGSDGDRGSRRRRTFCFWGRPSEEITAPLGPIPAFIGQVESDVQRISDIRQADERRTVDIRRWIARPPGDDLWFRIRTFEGRLTSDMGR